ncbi:unnamed protein product, partial [Ilex paraguariensis]
ASVTGSGLRMLLCFRLTLFFNFMHMVCYLSSRGLSMKERKLFQLNCGTSSPEEDIFVSVFYLLLHETYHWYQSQVSYGNQQGANGALGVWARCCSLIRSPQVMAITTENTKMEADRWSRPNQPI